MPQPSSSPTRGVAVIDTILTRLIVPGWVLTGAIVKMNSQDPRKLPSVILKQAKSLLGENYNPDILLQVLIGLELFAVLVMFLIPRLARAMAIWMLSCFCLILVGEMINKAASCGCMGSVTMKPWQMLIIDGTLLAAVIGCGLARRLPRMKTDAAPAPRRSLFGPIAATIPLLAIGLGASYAYARIDHSQAQQQASNGSGNATTQPMPAPPVPDGGITTQPAGPTTVPVVSIASDRTVNPSPMHPPRSWYIKGKAEDWVGQPWRELDLFKLMVKWPKQDLDHGKHYVVFYSRTCEHCEAMFYDDLIGQPADYPLTAVQLPSSSDEMTPDYSWTMPGVKFELLEMPLGCNYVVTPPIALRIVDGKVECATEGEDHKTCLELY